MKLSVVTTLYRSAPYLQEFYERAGAAAREVAFEDYEIVLVNDGSPDDSLRLALDLYARDPHVCVVDLSRNFGHHRAMLTGLLHARGERVFLLDCDLEEPPEELARFWRTMDEEEGLDVVYGVRVESEGRSRLSARLFDRLYNAIAETRVAADVLHLRLMSRRYVEALRAVREQDLYLPGIFEFLGFRQKALPVRTAFKGSSTYTLAKKLRLAISALTSFSSFPLKVSFYGGFSISLLAFVFMGVILYRVLVLGTEFQAGWPSVMVSIWFLGGVILMAIGVMGAYISRIYREVRGRPFAIVRAVHRRAGAGRGAAAEASHAR